MSDSATRLRGRRSAILGIVALLVSTLVLALPTPALGVGDVMDTHRTSGDVDRRVGRLAPTAAQKAIVRGLGAKVTWNRFGTPATLLRYGGYLASGLSGTPVQAARGWIAAHRGLFRLSAAEVQSLQLLNDSRLAGGAGHAVIFRQRFGSLPAAQDGMITVGIRAGRIAIVTSSAAGNQGTPAPATLTPLQAWVRAARDAGRDVSAADVDLSKQFDGWTVMRAQGFSHPQRARLVALPTPLDGAKAAYETIVLDVRGGHADAFTSFVDARTGQVLFRQNREYQLSPGSAVSSLSLPAAAVLAAPQTGTFSGVTGAVECGPLHEFEAPPGTQSIHAAAAGRSPLDDIVIKLIYVEPDPDQEVANGDTLFSPETVHYTPAVVPPGTYAVQVCPYQGSGPIQYDGAYTVSDQGGDFPYPPRWKYFHANPPLDLSDTDTRIVGCWQKFVDGTPVPNCDEELRNLASRAPWDVDVVGGAPTFTTKGNNAITGEAWLSPLTPAEQYRPVAPDRNYIFTWTDEWENTKCSPTALGGTQRNDIDAAVTNLFVMHNRMHDWAYFLGFTEQNFNLQQSNFGNGPPGPFPNREADPEIGNAQAGAVSGGAPVFNGRNNANQITLNDGIAPITNMYLWQPVPAGFYPPCVDGDYDMSVIGHEYTHAISNRMVGGPDANLTGLQAGAMGESWSDLNAVEYLNANGYVPVAGENPFAVGPYVTGDPQAGIRNYGMNASPLNYSNVGYDFVCTASLVGPPVEDPCTLPEGQVHADGEIWSATNYDIRQALIQKYNAQFPASNQILQSKCAQGLREADLCPGNRRWIQIVFDAWLLMQPSVSMVDARNAYLAADQMRFGGDNQVELWRAFAKRGLGQHAASDTNVDVNPAPSFITPEETNEATVNFTALARNEGNAPVSAKIFVGHFEARSRPIVDTDPATGLSATARFVPGTYSFVAQAPGYGHFKFSLTLTANQTRDVTLALATNWASAAKGGAASGDGENDGSIIDDREATNWAALGLPLGVAGAQITVDLGGGVQTIRRVQVSALLRPPNGANANDPAGQSRFTALRSFDIATCTASVANANCAAPAAFTKIFDSPSDAFPAAAPRPRAPDLLVRSFDVPDGPATHVRLIVETNQCTGGPDFQGDQDNDPANNSDCPSGSVQDQSVRAAELQVFSSVSSLGAPGGGGGGALPIIGHAHTDYNPNGHGGAGDVHVFIGPHHNSLAQGHIGYDDLRPNPPGELIAQNFRCDGTPTATQELSGNTVRVEGTVECRSFSRAKQFRMDITDNGPNPPNADHYHFTLYNRFGEVIYNWGDDTTVGMGDLELT